METALAASGAIAFEDAVLPYYPGLVQRLTLIVGDPEEADRWMATKRTCGCVSCGSRRACPRRHSLETRRSMLGRRLGSVGLGVALAVVLAGAVAAAAGVAVISGAITGHPGLWDPGQPLACSGL